MGSSGKQPAKGYPARGAPKAFSVGGRFRLSRHFSRLAIRSSLDAEKCLSKSTILDLPMIIPDGPLNRGVTSLVISPDVATASIDHEALQADHHLHHWQTRT